MSAIAEAHGWAKTARKLWDKAARETDPAQKAALEKRARYWDDEAGHAWNDARHEADEDAAFEHDIIEEARRG